MTEHPNNHLIGKSITRVRKMSREEMDREDWGHARKSETVVLELDDGTTIFPSRDSEGNGPGALFGSTADEKTQFYVVPA